jgi:TPR repeat protein
MPARATQPAGVPAGQAQVQVIGAGEIDAASLEVCISGIVDAVEKHLDPRLTESAWTTTLVWFSPANARSEGPALLFDLEASVTWHLRPHTPYVLRLRDAHGQKREERLTWVAIRLPSQAPRGYVAPAGPKPKAAAPTSAPPASAPPAVDVEAAMKQEAERAAAEERAAASAAAELQRKQAEETRRTEEAERQRREAEETEKQQQKEKGTRGGGKGLLIGGAVAVALLVAGGAWYFKDKLFGEQATEAVVPPAQPAIPTTLAGARQFLASNPGADESFGLAEKFREAKQLDGAFLLLRNAAGKGNAAAALALGEMYDPATYSPETSPLPAPNPTQAAEWYKQAAEAGIAEAQYRYGVLLMSGKTEEPNGPEKGVAWLQKAADQGHQNAKEALPK